MQINLGGSSCSSQGPADSFTIHEYIYILFLDKPFLQHANVIVNAESLSVLPFKDVESYGKKVKVQQNNG